MENKYEFDGYVFESRVIGEENCLFLTNAPEDFVEVLKEKSGKPVDRNLELDCVILQRGKQTGQWQLMVLPTVMRCEYFLLYGGGKEIDQFWEMVLATKVVATRA